MLAAVFEGVLLAAALLLAVPALVLLLQTLSAGPLPPPGVASKREEDLRGDRPSVALLVPAHDEAAGISKALATMLPQLRPGDRLLVVADNCTDATASIARAAGAEVIERHDPDRRGKGYALDFGVRALEARPPGIVVIIDADCTLEAQAIDRLVRCCAASGRPAQALYRMHAPEGSGPGRRIAEFAWTVRNQVRPLGGLRRGMPCQLMGSGMAFPWQRLSGAALASGHLVEDMQLGVDLAIAGASPMFCPGAALHSMFPAAPEGVDSQRTRWEHGHFAVMRTAVPRLLWASVRQLRPDLLGLALDLAVPPLAALVLATVALLSICAVAFAFGVGATPLVIVAVTLGSIVAAIGVAHARYARGIVSPRDFLAIPGYVLGKLPIYLRLLRRRQVDWVRTKRDGNSN